MLPRTYTERLQRNKCIRESGFQFFLLSDWKKHLTHEKEDNKRFNATHPAPVNSAYHHVHHNRYFSTTVRPNFSWTSLGVSIWDKQEISHKIPQGIIISNACIETSATYWVTHRIEGFEDCLNCIMRISGTNDLSMQLKLEQRPKLEGPSSIHRFNSEVSYLWLDILKTS